MEFNDKQYQKLAAEYGEDIAKNMLKVEQKEQEQNTQDLKSRYGDNVAQSITEAGRKLEEEKARKRKEYRLDKVIEKAYNDPSRLKAVEEIEKMKQKEEDDKRWYNSHIRIMKYENELEQATIEKFGREAYDRAMEAREYQKYEKGVELMKKELKEKWELD